MQEMLKLKFAIFSDLHYDSIPDGKSKIEDFLISIKRAKSEFSYSKETHKTYPYLKDLILYEDALHIIVNIDDDMNVSINVINGHYQKHSPHNIGIENIWNEVSIEAKTPNVYIKVK